MRNETERRSLLFPMAHAHLAGLGQTAPNVKPCHGCAVDGLVTLGCYGALFLLDGNAFRPLDRLLLEGFYDTAQGRMRTITAEVVRRDGQAVAVAFDQELSESMELRPPLRVVRLLPVCPMD